MIAHQGLAIHFEYEQNVAVPVDGLDCGYGGTVGFSPNKLYVFGVFW